MKKNAVIIILIVFVTLSVFAQTPPEGWKGKIEIIEGVRHVHNPATPLHPKLTVTFMEDLSLGGEKQAGDVMLYSPFLSFVDNNENIYITETQDLVIKVFNSDGKYIRTIGAKGSGPGELRHISGMPCPA